MVAIEGWACSLGSLGTSAVFSEALESALPSSRYSVYISVSRIRKVAVPALVRPRYFEAQESDLQIFYRVRWTDEALESLDNEASFISWFDSCGEG